MQPSTQPLYREIKIPCPLTVGCKEQTVYVYYRIENNELTRLASNGCDFQSGDPACIECARKAEQTFKDELLPGILYDLTHSPTDKLLEEYQGLKLASPPEPRSMDQ